MKLVLWLLRYDGINCGDQEMAHDTDGLES